MPIRLDFKAGNALESSNLSIVFLTFIVIELNFNLGLY